MTLTDNATLSLMGSIVAALIGAIRILYTRQAKLYDGMSEAAGKCEEDRRTLLVKIERLEDRMGECPARNCPLRPPRPRTFTVKPEGGS
ncbi:MAG: hypothetical protein V4726_05730 [Verrucomicrobiota bacterium]